MIRAGIENLAAVDSALKGARVALMTNPTGVDFRLRSSIDIIASRYRLTALLACEHGVRGCIPAGEQVSSFVDSSTRVTVYSC